MASFSSKFAVLSLQFIFAVSWMAIAADVDFIYGYPIPENVSADQLFLSSNTPNPNVKQAMKDQFSASGYNDGVALTTLQFPSGTVTPFNVNPYSAELLFLLEGTLEVGFIDTENKLYTSSLQTGDIFVVPKGLVNYHYNPDGNSEARTIAVYSSLPGTNLLPISLLSSGIDDGILAKSFKTDKATIQKLKAGLGSHS